MYDILKLLTVIKSV